MSTEITPAQVLQAAQIVRSLMPGDRASDHTYGRLLDWSGKLKAKADARARDLVAAQIIADARDGDPVDYLDAVPALREHFAAQALEAELIDAEIVELPVGRRFRDRDGDVWRMLSGGHLAPLVSLGFSPRFTSLNADFGPLHEVYESWADVPEWVSVTGGDGVERQGCANQCSACAVNGHAHADQAPFVAVEPFGGAA